LHPRRDARDGQHEAEHDEAAEGQDGRELMDEGRDGRRHDAAVDQATDERLERRVIRHRSISGATRSRLAITAIRSAIINLRLRCCVMLMAANEPVRILQRCGKAVPSLTTYQPMSPRALSRRT